MCAENIFYICWIWIWQRFRLLYRERKQLSFIPVSCSSLYGVADRFIGPARTSSYQSKTLQKYPQISIYQKRTDFFGWWVPKIALKMKYAWGYQEREREKECPTFVLFALNISCNPVKCISWVTFVYRDDIYAMKILEWLYESVNAAAAMLLLCMQTGRAVAVWIWYCQWFLSLMCI